METLSEKVSLAELKTLEDYKDVVLDKTESPLSPLTSSINISSVNGREDCPSPDTESCSGDREVSPHPAPTASSRTASGDENDGSTKNSKLGSDKNSCVGDDEDDDDGEDEGGCGGDEDDDDDDNISCKKNNDMDISSIHSPSSSSSR